MWYYSLFIWPVTISNTTDDSITLLTLVITNHYMLTYDRACVTQPVDHYNVMLTQWLEQIMCDSTCRSLQCHVDSMVGIDHV